MSAETEYPQLGAVLRQYIASDREDYLVLRYREVGEESLEFDGLAAELQRAAKNPESAREVFRETLGFEGDPSEIREGCVSLYDRLKGVGDYDEAKQERVEGSELFAKYAGIPFVINGKPVMFRGQVVPLWATLVLSFALLLIGYVLGGVIPLPGFLEWFPTLFRGVGFIAFFISCFALIAKRGEVRDPGKAARRAKSIREAKARRDAKKEAKGGSWWDRNARF